MGKGKPSGVWNTGDDDLSFSYSGSKLIGKCADHNDILVAKTWYTLC